MTQMIITLAVAAAASIALARVVSVALRGREIRERIDIEEAEAWWDQVSEVPGVPAVLTAGIDGPDWVRETLTHFPPGWLELFTEMGDWLNEHARQPEMELAAA